MISIGVAQIANSLELEKNFKSIMGFLERFRNEGVDLVVFPECGLSGFSTKMKECTTDILQPYLERVQSWSLESSIDVILPTAIVENQKIYNSGFWFKKDSKIQFYKIGLTDSEKNFFILQTMKLKKCLKLEISNAVF